MKYRFLIYLLPLLLICSAAVNAQDGTRITMESFSNSNAITGPGSGASSLTGSSNYFSSLSIHSDSGNETNKFSFDMSGKYADDPRTDPSMFSFTNINMKFAGPNTVLNLGDTFDSFSQYSLSSALKGLSYKLGGNESDNQEITFVYGLAYPRWDNFRNSTDLQAIKRQAYGAKLKKGLSQYFTSGFSYIRSHDSDRITPADQLTDGGVFAWDWEYKPVEGARITGESAWSGATLSPAAGAADVDSKGTAHRVAFEGQGGPVRLSVEYERVSPGFESVMGSSTPDREKVKVRWREKKSARTSLTYGILWFKDNLSGQKDSTRNSWRPEVALTLKNLMGRPYGITDLSYKLDKQYGGPQGTTNHFTNLGYNDRFGMWDSNTNLGFTKYGTTLGGQDTGEFTYNTAVSTRVTRGNTILKPSLSLGGWTASDELADVTDRIYEVALGMGVDLPKRNISSTFKLGKHKLLKGDALADDTSKLFASATIYTRAAWLQNGARVYLKWQYNDFSYTNGVRNFTESGFTVGVNTQY